MIPSVFSGRRFMVSSMLAVEIFKNNVLDKVKGVVKPASNSKIILEMTNTVSKCREFCEVV